MRARATIMNPRRAPGKRPAAGRRARSGPVSLRLPLRARFLPGGGLALAAGGFLRGLCLAVPALEKRDAVGELVLQRALQAGFEEGEHRRLFRAQIREVLAQLALDFSLDLEE